MVDHLHSAIHGQPKYCSSVQKGAVQPIDARPVRHITIIISSYPFLSLYKNPFLSLFGLLLLHGPLSPPATLATPISGDFTPLAQLSVQKPQRLLSLILIVSKIIFVWVLFNFVRVCITFLRHIDTQHTVTVVKGKHVGDLGFQSPGPYEMGHCRDVRIIALGSGPLGRPVTC